MAPRYIALISIILVLSVVYVGSPTAAPEQVEPVDQPASAATELNAAERRWQLLTRQQQRMVEAFQNGPPRMVCFAPGTSTIFQEEMDKAFDVAMAKSMKIGRQSSNYVQGTRWARTATNGTAVGSAGDPITLTWTVVPDGTPIQGSSSDWGNGDDSELQGHLDTLYGNKATWLPLFEEVFDGWSAVTGITYVYVDYGNSTTAVPSANGTLSVEADIRISGHSIDGDASVLAYNYFPSYGDMVIDTDELNGVKDLCAPTNPGCDSEDGDAWANDYFHNLTNSSRRLRNMLYHEHGHGIGLGHVCPVNNTKIMEPYLNTVFDGLQHDDIRGGNAGYGDPSGSNNSIGNASDVTVTHDATTTVSDLSIDKSSEADYFKFTIAQTGIVRVVAKPSGESYYDDVPISGATCPTPNNYINSKAIQNLSVTVYDTDMSTVLRSSDLWPIGEDESSQIVKLTSTGTYYIRVATSSGAYVQMYDLDISLTDELHPMGVPTSDTNLAFGDINLTGASVQAYNAGTQAYESVSDIDTKRGYWVQVAGFSPDFSSYDNPVVGTVTYTLSAGWNLLSVPSDVCFDWDTSLIDVENGSTVDLETAAKTHAWVEDYAWIYDESSGQYDPIYNTGDLGVGGNKIPGGSSFWFYSHYNNVDLIFDVPMTGVCVVTP